MKYIIIITLFFLSACTKQDDVEKASDVVKQNTGGKGGGNSGGGGSSTSGKKPNPTQVRLIGDQLIVNGTDLSEVTGVQITGSGLDAALTIVSKTASQLILSASSTVDLAIDTALNLIISNAHGATAVTVTFDVQDSSITTDHIADGQVTAVKLADMGASTGQILKYDGSSWVASDFNALTYAGTWDASTASEPNASPSAGEYYIVSVAASNIDLGDGAGSRDWFVGDWIVYNGTTSEWDRVAGSSEVISFNGRTGAVAPASGDYTWAQIDKSASDIGDITNVDTTGAVNGSVLKFDGSDWVVGVDEDTGLTNVTSADITDDTIVNDDINSSANISQSKIQNLTTDLASKLPLDGSSAMTGNLNMGSQNITSVGTVDGVDVSALNTQVQTNSTDITTNETNITANTNAIAALDTDDVSEATNLYFTEARVLGTDLSGYTTGANSSIAASDTVLEALGKTQGQIDAINSATSEYVQRDGSVAMTGSLNLGSNAITGGTSATFSGNGTFGVLRPTDTGSDSNFWELQENGSNNFLFNYNSATQAVVTTDGKLYITEICDEAGANCKDASGAWSTTTGDITAVNTNSGSGLSGGAATGDATLQVVVDDSTVEIATNTIQLKDGGITNAKINATAAIAYSKLNIADADLTIAKTNGLQTALDAKALQATALTAGDGLAGGGDLSADRSFSVNVDDSTIEIDTDTLRLKDDGITNAKINSAAAIAYSKLNIADADLTIAKTNGLQTALDAKFDIDGSDSMTGDLNLGSNALTGGTNATFSGNGTFGVLRPTDTGSDSNFWELQENGSNNFLFNYNSATQAVVTTDGKLYITEICDEAGANCKDASGAWSTTTGDITAVNTNSGSGLSGGAATGDATLQVVVDDSTVEIATNTIQLKDGGITNAKINATAAIAYSKLNIADADLTIAKTNGLQTALDAKALEATTLTAGDGLAGGGDLSAGRSFSVNVDDATVEINADTVRLKDDGITNAKINSAAAIAYSKLNIADADLTIAKTNGLQTALDAKFDIDGSDSMTGDLNLGSNALTGGTNATFSGNGTFGVLRPADTGSDSNFWELQENGSNNFLFNYNSATQAVVTTDGKLYITEICDEAGANCKDASGAWSTTTGDITAVNTNSGSGLSGGAATGDATLQVVVDDSTVEIATNTIQLKDGGITNAKINATAAIAYSKLNIADADLTIAKTNGLQTALDAKALHSTTLTAGDGLAGGGDLSAGRSFSVNVDDATVEINADTIRLKDDGITNAKINSAAAIAYSKLNIADADLTIAKTNGLQTALDAKFDLDGSDSMTGDLNLGSNALTGGTNATFSGNGTFGVLRPADTGTDSNFWELQENGSNNFLFNYNSATQAVVTTDGKLYITEICDEAGANCKDASGAWSTTTGDITAVNTNSGSGLSGGAATGDATLQVVVDDSTVEIATNTIGLKDGGITNAKINATAAIAYSKLNIADADLTIAKTNGLQTALDAKALEATTLTAGDGLAGGGDLSAGRSFSVNVDDTTVEINADTVRLKDDGITNAKINSAAAIAYSKLNIADADLTIAKTNGLQTALDAKFDLDGSDSMTGALNLGSNAITNGTSATFSGNGTFGVLRPADTGSDTNFWELQENGSNNFLFNYNSATQAVVTTDGKLYITEICDEAGANCKDASGAWSTTTGDMTAVNTNSGSGLSGGAATGDATLQVVVDDSTVEIATNTIQLKDGGITNAKINATAAIAYSKLNIADADLTIAKTNGLQTALDAKALHSTTLTAGDGLAGGGDLSAGRSFSVNVDDATVEINADTIRLKDDGITNAKINSAAAIAYSKLNIADGDLTIAKTSGLQTALDAKFDLDGSDSMTGALNLGSNAITNGTSATFSGNGTFGVLRPADTGSDTNFWELQENGSNNFLFNYNSATQAVVTTDGKLYITEICDEAGANCKDASGAWSTTTGDMTAVNTNSGSGLSGGATSGDVTLQVVVDDSTVEIATNTIQLKDGGITNAKINATAAIAYSKLSIADADLTIAKTNGLQTALDAKALGATTLTAGDGLAGGGDLSAGRSFSVNVDDATVEINADTVRLKDDGITNAKINSAAAIAYSKLNIADADLTIAKTNGLQTALDAKALGTTTLTAGDGLAGGGDLSAGRTFSVNVDDSTIETNADTLRVKDLGITNSKISSVAHTKVTTACSDGQLLTASSGAFVCANASSVGNWTASGGDIYFNFANVGIGTTDPESKLHVNGGVCVTSDDTCSSLPSSGEISAETTLNTGADYAEYFEAEESLSPGDLVGLNPESLKARGYQKGDSLIGIVSTKPGVVGNSKLAGKENVVLVALTGQVPFDDAQVSIDGNLVRTLDGKALGFLLASGDVYINLSSVDEDQNRDIASLKEKNGQLEQKNKELGDKIEFLMKEFQKLKSDSGFRGQ